MPRRSESATQPVAAHPRRWQERRKLFPVPLAGRIPYDKHVGVIGGPTLEKIGGFLMPGERDVVVGHLLATFDMITVRELDVIRQLRARHRRIRIAVIDDDTVTALYGRPPITPLVERALLAQHIRGVDEVVVHDPTRPMPHGEQQICYAIAGEPVPLPLDHRVLTPGVVTTATLVNEATAALGQAVA